MSTPEAEKVFDVMTGNVSDYQLWTNGYTYRIYKREGTEWKPMKVGPYGDVKEFEGHQLRVALTELASLQNEDYQRKAPWEPISPSALQKLYESQKIQPATNKNKR